MEAVRTYRHGGIHIEPPSAWSKYPNRPLYQDMQKYGVGKFRVQLLAPVMPEYLKQVEQELIEMLKPIYNNYNAYGDNVERQNETSKKCKNKYHQEHKEHYKKYLINTIQQSSEKV